VKEGKKGEGRKVKEGEGREGEGEGRKDLAAAGRKKHVQRR
jgi:hypothetical protein